MSLHPLAQLGQVALALGLGAALGLLFDVLRVPRRHARRAFLRAVLDAVFCLAVGLTVFAFGMAAGSGQVRLFMFLAIAAGWTGYFAWVSGQVLPRKKRANLPPPDRNLQKKFGFLQKNASKIAADVLE